jgi:hypothetical protein
MRSELPVVLHLLRVLLAAIGGLSLLVCAFGLLVVFADHSSDTDTWDGLAAALALLAISFIAPVGLVALALVWLVSARPAVGAMAAVATGVGLVLLPLAAGPALGLPGRWFVAGGGTLVVLALAGLAGLAEATD